MVVTTKLLSPAPEIWAFVACQSGVQPEEIEGSIEKAFAQLTEAIARGAVRTCGAPRAHYHYRDGAQLSFELGFPILADDAPAAERAGLGVGHTLSGKALTFVFEGPYAGLRAGYQVLERDLKSRGLSGAGDTWEVYLNDPDSTPPEKLQTEIYWPIAENAAP